MDVVGFAHIKKDAKSGIGCDDLSGFLGKDVRVMEFARDGGVLVVNDDATGMAMFDKEDVFTKFECTFFSNVVCPPKLNFMEQAIYYDRCMNRKGGYNKLMCNLVIQVSLVRGTFTDSLLWQLQ